MKKKVKYLVSFLMVFVPLILMFGADMNGNVQPASLKAVAMRLCFCLVVFIIGAVNVTRYYKDGKWM